MGIGQPMVFQQPFDARTVEPSTAFEPVPPGDYKVVVEKSETVANKENTGGMLRLHLNIIEGPYMNRKLVWNLNLFNQSEQAVNIANKELSALCYVTGVIPLNTSAQLHNIPFIVSVAVQPGGQYNNVRGVKHLDGSSPGKGQTAIGGGQPPQQPSAQPQSWGPPAPVAPAAPQQPQYQPPQPQPAPYQQPPAQAPAWGQPPTTQAPPAWGQPPAAPQQPQAPQQQQWTPGPPAGAPAGVPPWQK